MYEALRELMEPKIDQEIKEAVSKAVAEKDAAIKEKDAEIRALKARLATANA